MNNGDLPASPIFNSEGAVGQTESGCLSGESMGLTKREYLAAMAMQGITSCFNIEYGVTDGDCEGVAKDSVRLADSLLAALKDIDNG